LSKLVAELLPPNITGLMFPSSGNEANECAIRMARLYTGRHKILNTYRSYHGGSTSTLTATGDFRRWYGETGATGFVKMFNPTPLMFKFGENEEAATATSLAALEEQILAENPNSIAAVMIESISGSGGVLVTPKGYMQGVRALCDKYNILLILDEVMVGFGRTGKMFGFQHFDGVTPDITTFAKGLTGGILPLGGVGMSTAIQDHFRTNPLGWGATYHAHPVAMACAYETIKYLLDKDLVGNAASLESVMKEEISKIQAAHPCVRQSRVLGLFGCMDLQNRDGRYVQRMNEAPPPEVLKFKARLHELGIYAFFRSPLIHCAPPLIITEPELRDGFSRINEALDVMD